MQSDTLQFYSYEHWIKKSIHLFQSSIAETSSDFDEKDHKLASEYNESIYKALISLSNAWIKRWAAFDLVRLIMPFIYSKETLHASGQILAEKIKICLSDLKKIDSSLKNPDTEWFYELLAQYKVQQLIEPLIETVNKRIDKTNLSAVSAKATHP